MFSRGGPPFSFWDYGSQSTLVVTRQCHLKCSGCPLWAKTDYHDQNPVTLMKEGRFFDHYPRKRLIHLVGGDPFCHEDLLYIITFLKAEGVKIQLWTHVMAPLDDLVLCGKVDHTMLFLPYIDADQYREHVGVTTFSEFQTRVALLKGEQYSFSFHCPVTPENVSVLPDISEFAYQYGRHVLFHYYPKDPFLPDAIPFLLRFRRVNHVSVLARKKQNSMICPAFPGEGIYRRHQLFLDMMGKWLRGF